MKLQFTRKTWYFMLLAAAAASMLNGMAVLAGREYLFIEQFAFCAEALALLFLAAQKGSKKSEKQAYFLVFSILMFSYILSGWPAHLSAAAVWPSLLYVEYNRGAPVARQARLVGAAEALHLAFLLASLYGGVGALRFWANLLWVLLACARGWAAMTLYRWQQEEKA